MHAEGFSARPSVPTQNWSSLEYVAFFNSKLEQPGCENWKLKHFSGRNRQRTELADLTKIQRSAALNVESTQLLRKTLLYTLASKMPRTSLALVRAWRDWGVGGCQNTTVHNLEVRFCKISSRSNYRCGQR